MNLKIVQRNEILGTCLALDGVYIHHMCPHSLSASEPFATLCARFPPQVKPGLQMIIEFSSCAKLNLALVAIHFYNI